MLGGGNGGGGDSRLNLLNDYNELGRYFDNPNLFNHMRYVLLLSAVYKQEN